MKMKKITLIDGNSLLYRAYYATAAVGNLMTNKDGIPTNAIFGFANMLDRILKDEPDYLMVAFDAGKKTFRHELQKDYKGTRKETPDELIMQFDLVREYLDCRHIVHHEMEGYEGDDLIGTVSRMAEEAGMEVAVITGDQDMLQLVSNHTTVYRTMKGVTQLEANVPATLKAKYDLEPDQIRDLKGLMGDASDNIPGIKGVGEKTALKLLHQYGTVENLSEHLDELKGKMGEKVRDGIQAGLDSKQIATIMRDVPIDFDLESLTRQSDDEAKLADFYRRYDMYSLLKKMEQPRTTSSEVSYQLVNQAPQLTKDFTLVVGVYDNNYHKSIVLGYAVYSDEACFYISYEDALKDKAFQEVLKNEAIHKNGYNIKREMIASRWNGIEIQGYDYDMQLASYILNPSLKDDLKVVSEFYDYHDLVYAEEIFGKGAKRHIPALADQAKYYLDVAMMIHRLKSDLISRLKQDEQYELYENIELPLTYILAKMEYNGVKVNVDTLKQQEKALSGRIALLEKEIYALAGTEFNIASPKQLGEILFEKLQLPNGKKTKTGYSTAAEVLEKLVGFHPIVQKILDYRTLTKLNSTYLVGLQEQVFLDGRIHTMYNQALTQTGRLSSTDPNLQNIPIRYEEGKKIRQAFVPEYDYILSYDYSQIELRVVASLANVHALIDAFNHDMDIHTKTASDIFHVPVTEVTKDMRRQAKAINFGIIYGMSDFGLAEQVGVSIAQAKDFINRYFATYPEIKEYMDQVIDFAKKNGYVSTMMNRRRYIPEINDKNFMRRELGKRLAMNSPIQGSAADLLKVAMIKVDRLMQEHHVQSKMILQVHDELVFDVKADELEIMKKIVKEGMESAYPMAVNLKAEGAIGKTWYDLK